jgi:hypothetical protein
VSPKHSNPPELLHALHRHPQVVNGDVLGSSLLTRDTEERSFIK